MRSSLHETIKTSTQFLHLAEKGHVSRSGLNSMRKLFSSSRNSMHQWTFCDPMKKPSMGIWWKSLMIKNLTCTNFKWNLMFSIFYIQIREIVHIWKHLNLEFFQNPLPPKISLVRRNRPFNVPWKWFLYNRKQRKLNGVTIYQSSLEVVHLTFSLEVSVTDPGFLGEGGQPIIW